MDKAGTTLDHEQRTAMQIGWRKLAGRLLQPWARMVATLRDHRKAKAASDVAAVLARVSAKDLAKADFSRGDIAGQVKERLYS